MRKWIRKRIALALFDLGTGVRLLGCWLQRDGGHEADFIRWQSRIERSALVKAFDE